MQARQTNNAFLVLGGIRHGCFPMALIFFSFNLIRIVTQICLNDILSSKGCIILHNLGDVKNRFDKLKGLYCLFSRVIG